MAQIAKPAAGKATDDAKNTTDHAAEQGERAANRAAEATREATERAADAARQGLHVVERTVGAAAEVERAVAQRSVEGTAELGQALVDLMQEQTRHNLETLRAFGEAIDWDRVARAVDWDRMRRIQAEYLQVSLERAAELTRRYLEVSQAVVTAAASVAQREAKKAA